MDFNDLDGKLKRLYASLGEQYDENISDNIVDAHTVFDDGRFEHRTTFGSNRPEKNQNVVMGAIHLIGSIKDLIKQKLRAADQDPQAYEKLINDNLCLALITDLDNKDKHGDPLTLPERSGKNPKIMNVEQVLRGRGITRVSFTTDFTTGKTKLNSVEGNVKIIVTADVVDSSGVLIMPFHIMLEESLELINRFITDHSLAESSM